MNPPRLSALILAAGASSRMGRFKPLLPLDGRSVIERLVSVFVAAGVARIVVVVGHRGHEIAGRLREAPVKIVENPDFARGMYSSVQAGARALGAISDGLFVQPADIPLIRPWTLWRLVQRWGEAPGKIIHPGFGGKTGHPPLLPGRIAEEIAADQDCEGLHQLLSRHLDDAVVQEVPDRHILMDMDTPEAYETLKGRWLRYDVPDPEECRVVVWDQAADPEAVWRHGRAVARAAAALADRIAERGGYLDQALIEAAALLHDVAKGKPNHARAGAQMLHAMGFGPVAEIVARHMTLTEKPGTPPGEADLVYLADKHVAGERTVSMTARFDMAMARFGADPQARRAVAQRRDEAMAVRDRVERLLGCSVASVLGVG